MTIHLKSKNVVGLTSLFGLVVLAVATLFVCELQSARRSMQRMSCTSNLKKLGVALHYYCATYGTFPPAYTSDHSGKRGHSWRVLILPFLGEKTLYSRYNFDEPWDSPANRRLAGLMPKCYWCPSDTGGNGTKTSYLAVVGPHAAWRGPSAVGYSDINEFTTQKIMLVEAVKSGIDWMEPCDLSFDEAAVGVNRGARLGISSQHGHLANCLFVDGSVHSLDDNISPEVLADLLSIDYVGRKPLDLIEPITGWGGTNP